MVLVMRWVLPQRSPGRLPAPSPFGGGVYPRVSRASLALPSREMCAPPSALALSMRPLTVLVRPVHSAGRRHKLGVHGGLL